MIDILAKLGIAVIIFLGLLVYLALAKAAGKGSRAEEKRLDENAKCIAELDSQCDCYCRDCHRQKDCEIYKKYS